MKFAVTEVAGHGAAAMLEQGVDAAAEYIAERTELEPDEVAHLAIAGGTIIGGVVLGWSAVKNTVKDVPKAVDGIRRSMDNFRRDETGSVPGGGGSFRGDWESLENSERSFVERELAAGRNIEAIPTGPDKTPDFRIDGVLVELKTLEGTIAQTSNALSAAISNRAMNGRAQSGNVVIEGTMQAGLTEEIAMRGVSRAYGADSIEQKFESIRVVGPDFDITIPARY